jgi:lipopolysaccharide export system ATP-binding protein
LSTPSPLGTQRLKEDQWILQGRDLRKRYKKRDVVDGVSLFVRQGEIVGLLGPNGAGKTTTFYLFVGHIRANGGSILLNDRDISPLPMYLRARKGIGYLSQEPSVFRDLTVEENLSSVMQYAGLSNAEIRQKTDELIEEFNLQKVAKGKGYSLSGGERRRTEIARALATDPKFILLDEPFAGVDPIAVEDIQEIVSKLRHRNIGIFITDHNVHETLAITDRAYLMYEGKILKEGTAEELANDDEAKKLYLGKNFSLNR